MTTVSEEVRPGQPTDPRLSVVVLCHRMTREVPRTIASLAPAYQRIDPHQYEIELVETPSDEMLEDAHTRDFPANLRHTVEPQNAPLPVVINRAVRRTRGRHVLICVDGARILSSTLLHRAMQVVKINAGAVMAVHGLHLGHRPQQVAVREGSHSRQIEDELLAGIDFPNRPNDLWKIACWAGSSRDGWFAPMAESCALLVAREHFEAIGGYDENVTTPGGGLANSDFYTRATTGRPLFVALGEGTFHQYHGGSTTGADGDTWSALKRAFEEQTGRPFKLASSGTTHYLGALPPQGQALASQSLLAVVREKARNRPSEGQAAVRRAQGRAFTAVSAPAPRPPITLILGMHRSGTSFLARQMVRNGMRIPGTPMGGTNRSNPDGHFEPLEIVAWHNQTLAGLGSGWSALAPIDWTKAGEDHLNWRAHGLRRLLLDLAETPDADDDAAGLVVKDPRICRTLPLWERAIRLMERRPATIFVLRDPTLVAASLRRRDGFSLDFGRLLWARYVSDMLAWVEQPADIVCLDTIDADGLARYVEQRTGSADFSCEPVHQSALTDGSDPLTRLYRAFLADRDLAALSHGLTEILSFAEAFPDVARRLDRLGDTPD